jgi:hypothetical protein
MSGGKDEASSALTLSQRWRGVAVAGMRGWEILHLFTSDDDVTLVAARTGTRRVPVRGGKSGSQQAFGRVLRLPQKRLKEREMVWGPVREGEWSPESDKERLTVRAGEERRSGQ